MTDLQDAAEVAVTDADWEAAEGFGCGFCPDDMDRELAEAFARHRAAVEAATIAKVVAWLRGDEEGEWMVADAIEAGEWKQ